MFSTNASYKISLTNYVSFSDTRSSRPRIGHYDLNNQFIQPLSFTSGSPIADLYQVIEAGETQIVASGESLRADSVTIHPPITGRDILCVGKNYAEHATEFNSSGFDSSDKVDHPSHPVIFTKRHTSIIGHGEDIYPHPAFTQTLDFEGEIGVVIGKAGFKISEADAMDYVWGYTIINDMTARERQRDHKQFYIGKSPDTFCPMGPIAVPAGKLDKILCIQTHVNGALRQNATTEDLIFSIPTLIKTLSDGQTIQPGDILATGTPAGVGIGKKPPVYLRPNDEVAVTVSGLGTLVNRIGDYSSTNPTLSRFMGSSIKADNAVKAVNGRGLTLINNKPFHYKRLGSATGSAMVFVHGLGGTIDFWMPFIQAQGLESTNSLHLFDLEGHGLSPTSPLSNLSIRSFAEDLNGVFEHAEIQSGATLVAHSMGCLVAAEFALTFPEKVGKLVLLGPPPSPLPEAGSRGSFQRAETVRSQGMAAVVDAVVAGGTSESTKKLNPVALAAIRLSLLGQDPEGYAKACAALARSVAHSLDFSRISAKTLLVTGSEDNISPPQLCNKYSAAMPRAMGVKVLSSVGHWHVFEDLDGVVNATSNFLQTE